MQANDTVSRISEYARSHWFQIGVVAILLFVVFKKDLSFQINLNAPKQTEQEEEESRQPVRREESLQKREVFTERVAAPETKNSDVSRMDIAPLSLGKTSKTALERLASVDDGVKRAYLQRFAKVAQGEQKKYGVPASVLLATAMLMSQAGESEAARNGNNHFALPCTSDWKGTNGQYGGKCLRHYENAWTSFRDCSFFITTGANAQFCPKDGSDQDWAKALGKMGFAGGENFAGQVLRVIEAFDL